MIVLHRNHDQLIIGADTRKIALLTVGGYSLVCLGIYSLLSNGNILPPESIIPITLGLIAFLSIFVLYYFYHVFQNTIYDFDRVRGMLTITTITLFGNKANEYKLDQIKKVETRTTPTYAYTGHGTHTTDTYTQMKDLHEYNSIVLQVEGKKEVNLTPNAAYFFLHTFNHLTDEVDNGLGETIAEFLDIPFIKTRAAIAKTRNKNKRVPLHAR